MNLSILEGVKMSLSAFSQKLNASSSALHGPHLHYSAFLGTKHMPSWEPIRVPQCLSRAKQAQNICLSVSLGIKTCA